MGGEYRQAIGLLYGIALPIKKSKRLRRSVEGYFDYMVPTPVGLWQMDGTSGIDCGRKRDFQWISMIRLPEFVTGKDFDWAAAYAAAKKKTDYSKVEFFRYDEGLCVQWMHLGSYDQEPATVAAMAEFADANGLAEDFADGRRHHEIYLSHAGRCDPVN